MNQQLSDISRRQFRSNRTLASLSTALLIGLAGLANAQDTQATGPVQPGATGPAVASDAPAGSNAKNSTAPAIERVELDLETGDLQERVDRVLKEMTLAEKIGQLCQVFPAVGDKVADELAAEIRSGNVGSIFYAGSAEQVRQAQKIATEQSRLGIPLIVGRDVIHGFRTTFPIPLGQAASWNPELIERAAKVSAAEAKGQGINWTFAPMVDICRDPRWGRIAETLGEDPMLSGALATAMVRGFQQSQEGSIQGIVACAKHYAAYGLSEGGRDYNRASVSQADLHNIHLPPFRDVVRGGCQTIMTTFSEVNGIPGTAHDYLLRDVLKQSWGFDGFVVSDWASVTEMIAHGYSADEKQAALQSLSAGVDMEMVSTSFRDHLTQLCQSGQVSESIVDDAVERILRVKLQMTPFSKETSTASTLLHPRNVELARTLARQSMVLLKNQEQTLPLDANKLEKIAVVGPLADAAQSQLGCWVMDSKQEDSITPLTALKDALSDSAEVIYAPGAEHSFATGKDGIAEAVKAARQADVVVMILGEDATLSGEARSRTQLTLPGVQAELIEAVAATGKPVITVVLAGRPLAIGELVEQSDAVLYAWHPGTMAGPALVDLLLGRESPSGRLPVTFPRSVGQVPLYYGHTNTGRPSPADFEPLVGSGETDLKPQFQYRSHYVDERPFPLYPFGYGLSYTTFEYEDLELGTDSLSPKQTLSVKVRLRNSGKRAASEVVQLYIRDHVSSIIRPVRELKAFRRIHLKPGASEIVEFALTIEDIAMRDAEGELLIEPGTFSIWAGGDSQADLTAEFQLLESPRAATADLPAALPEAKEAESPTG